eukprot:3609451-Prymnesium_polylepis.1
MLSFCGVCRLEPAPLAIKKARMMVSTGVTPNERSALLASSTLRVMRESRPGPAYSQSMSASKLTCAISSTRNPPEASRALQQGRRVRQARHDSLLRLSTSVEAQLVAGAVRVHGGAFDAAAYKAVAHGARERVQRVSPQHDRLGVRSSHRGNKAWLANEPRLGLGERVEHVARHGAEHAQDNGRIVPARLFLARLSVLPVLGLELESLISPFCAVTVQKKECAEEALRDG